MHRCNCRDLGRQVESEFDAECLLVLLKRGDAAALDRLLERYRNYVLLLVRLQIGGREQGHADFQEKFRRVWLEIHKKSGLFRGSSEREFLAWVGKVVKLVLSHAVQHDPRIFRSELRLEFAPDDELDQSSFALNVSLVAPEIASGPRRFQCERAVLLADALHALPDEYREVIILRQLEGLSFPHVARRLGRTEESAKSTWLRALTQFRSTLEGLR
jgi:RNA polymerase sigma-70 factor (ECF subfamily)